MVAPMEDKLEEFYLALGASTLASLAQDDLRLGRASTDQKSVVKLRSHILERAKLFLHECDRSNIRHDSKWLEKNLSLQIVTSISLRRSLRGHTEAHTQKRSAAITHERHQGWTLFITEGRHDTYQISQAICPILLERPHQQSYLTFETFLNFNLYELRSRGYNVERILRAKAAEARIAEEERKKQMEVEQAQLREQEEQWKQQSQALVPAAAREDHQKSTQVAMPGAFGSDSPENSPQPTRSGRRGLFSGLTRRLGLDSSGEAQQQLQSFLGGGSGSHSHDDSEPPPQVDNPPTYDEASKGGPARGGQGPEHVSSPAAVQQNLLNAIQSSRAHDSSTLFSPPTTQTIKEQASYCDSTSAQNLNYLADASNGARLFVSRNVASPTEFLSHNVAALNSFAVLLYEIADVYALPRRAIHIFYDETGGTIAFNSNGSIFCNFRFFKQLHLSKIDSDRRHGRVEAGAYWWIVLAHELAHNLVKEHSAEHSFYT
jgi:hypothetical protein